MAWNPIGSLKGPPGRFFVSDTPPAEPAAGDGWFHSASGILYVYFGDGDSQQWVGVSGAMGPAGTPLSDAAPSGLGTPTSGLATAAARSDHVHSSTIAGLTEVRVAMSSNSIDVAAGGLFVRSIGADTTFSVTNTPDSGTVATFILDLTVTGATRAVSWWPDVKWAHGAPVASLPVGRYLVGFLTSEGPSGWVGMLLASGVA